MEIRIQLKNFLHRTLIPATLAAVLLGTAFLFFCDHPLNSDEGAVLNAAWNLWHGQKMYVDFLDFTAPGAAYFVLTAWKFTGQPTYLVAKLASVLLWLLSAVGLMRILKNLSCRTRMTFWGGLLWMIACSQCPLINHNVYSSISAIWLLYYLEKHTRCPCWRDSLFAGVTAAVTLFFIQTKGSAVSLAAFALILVLSPKNHRIKNGGFYLAGWITTAWLLFKTWPLRTLWDAWFVLPLKIGYLSRTFHVPDVMALEILMTLLLLLVAVRKKEKWVWTLFAFQTALFLSHLNLISFGHMVVNSFPFLIYAITQADRLLLKAPPKIRAGIYLSCLFPILLLITTTAKTHLAGNNILWTPPMLEKKTGPFAFPELRQAKYIYAGPFLPGLYTELGKPNPFKCTNAGTFDPECQQDTLTRIQSVKPEFILVDYRMVAKYGYDWNNPMDQYIFKNYRYCGQLPPSNIQLFARDRCPSR